MDKNNLLGSPLVDSGDDAFMLTLRDILQNRFAGSDGAQYISDQAMTELTRAVAESNPKLQQAYSDGGEAMLQAVLKEKQKYAMCREDDGVKPMTPNVSPSKSSIISF